MADIGPVMPHPPLRPPPAYKEPAEREDKHPPREQQHPHPSPEEVPPAQEPVPEEGDNTGEDDDGVVHIDVRV